MRAARRCEGRYSQFVLVHVVLLVIVGLGLASMVWLQTGTSRHRADALAAYAREQIAPDGPPPRRFEQGFTIEQGEAQISFTPDVFTEASLRAGIVDVWRVELVATSLAGIGAVSLFASAPAAPRHQFDVESRPLDDQNIDAALDAVKSALRPGGPLTEVTARLLGRHPIRRFALDSSGRLLVAAERRSATVRELDTLISDVRRVADTWARWALRPENLAPTSSTPALGPKSGAPVPVGVSSVVAGPNEPSKT